MLKVAEANESQLALYYGYIRNLSAIYTLITKKIPQLDEITKLLTANEEYFNQMQKEYAQSINARIDYYMNEAIYTRQKAFLAYVKNSYYFDIPDERNEELARILGGELKLIEYSSNVLNHKSLYNSSGDYALLMQASLSNMKRFLYFEQFFFWMKEYIEAYRKTMTTLLKESNCLSIQWKLYIALMAVCTMKNEFLFRVIEEEFLAAGGDEAWLIVGLDVVPTKLKQISLLNSLLAHQPWLIHAEDIRKLKASMGNIEELIEAALIMIQFHKLALIEENLQIKKAFTKSFTEKSLFKSSLPNSNNGNDSFNSKLLFEDEIDKETQADLVKLMEEIQKVEEESEECNLDDIQAKPSTFNKIAIKQESFHSFDIEKDGSLQDTISREAMFSLHTCADNQKIAFKGPHKDIICTYLNFNWCDNGKYALQNLYQKGVVCLEDEINYITSLNSNSLGQIDNLISTSLIRRAIDHYIESLFGYYHEDYNYDNIDKLLDMKIKYTRYIKKITCYPKKLSTEDLKDMAKVFTKEEVVHIVLIAALVKSRIQLVYLAKAVNEVMTSID